MAIFLKSISQQYLYVSFPGSGLHRKSIEDRNLGADSTLIHAQTTLVTEVGRRI